MERIFSGELMWKKSGMDPSRIVIFPPEQICRENTQRFTFIYTGNGAGTLTTTVGKLNMASTAEVSAEDGKRKVHYILTEEEFRKIPVNLTWKEVQPFYHSGRSR